MSRSLSLIVLGTSFVTMSSCCFTEQGNHAVRKMWCDYNTFRCSCILPGAGGSFAVSRRHRSGITAGCTTKIPDISLRAWARFRRGPVPTAIVCLRQRTLRVRSLLSDGIPRQSDQLWGNKLPEPINRSRRPETRRPRSIRRGRRPCQRRAKNGLVPILPPVPPPVEAPKAAERTTDFRSRRCGQQRDSAANAVATSDLRSSGSPIQADRRSPAPLQGPAAQKGPKPAIDDGRACLVECGNGSRSGCRLAKVTRNSKSRLQFRRVGAPS